MDKIYGAGMSRHLKPGEEASVIENIRKILEKCEISPEFFHFSISTTVKKILKKADLKSLENFPLCMKQTELHWKLMATRFRYSGNQLLKNKKFEKIFESTQCKHHFLNLNQDNNLLVLYLLKYSKKI